jgi:hypothetical protein
MIVVPDQIIDDAYAAAPVPALLSRLRPGAVRELIAQEEFDIWLGGFSIHFKALSDINSNLPRLDKYDSLIPQI